MKLNFKNKLSNKFKSKPILVNDIPVLIDFDKFIHNKKDFFAYLNKIKRVRSKPLIWKIFKSIIDGNPSVTKKKY